jgi:hypothetical protein
MMWDWQLPPRSGEVRSQNADKLMLNVGLFVCVTWFLFAVVTGHPF